MARTGSTAVQEQAMQQAGREAERISIMIPSDDSDMGREDVSVGFNGEVIRIQRDKVVAVKVGHFNALMDAVKTELIMDADGRVTGTRRMPRYNVQRVY